MAGNNSIQFLRGTSDQRKGTTYGSQKLLEGQPFYETDTNKLYVGGKDGTALSAARPIGEEALVTFHRETITYEKWVENCENGVYDNFVGQEATVKNFVFGQDWTLRLIGVNHDDNAVDGSKIKTTWEFTEIICRTPLGLPFDYYDYDSSSQTYYPSNAHGYGTATTLQTLLLSILSSMPTVVREHIKLAKKTCYIPRKYISSGSTTSGNQDEGYRLFCLSGIEIGAGTASSYVPSGEGTCYAYYAGIDYAGANTKRVKKEKSGSAWYYWLRSPNTLDTNRFCYVYIYGNVDYFDTHSSRNGVAPAFCI